MKKEVFALGILCLGLVPAFAQSSKSPFTKSQKAILNQLFAAQQPTRSFEQRPTGTQERVIGIAKYFVIGGDLSPMDSINYAYSGNRGSAFGFDILGTSYPCNTVDEIQAPNIQALSPYSGTGFVNYDSATYYVSEDGSFIATDICTQEFNSSHLISNFKGYRNTQQVSANFTYDALGRIMEIKHSNDEAKRWYRYDSDQQVYHSVDSNLYSKTVFTFDSDYRPIHSISYDHNAGPSEPNSENWINYNSAGLIDTIRLVESQDSGAIVFSYDPNTTTFSKMQTYSWDLSQLYWEEVRYLNAQQQTDSGYLYYPPDGEDPEIRTDYTLVYNDNKNPVKKTQIHTTEDGNIQIDEYYYYETYDEDGTAIASQHNTQLNFVCVIRIP